MTQETYPGGYYEKIQANFAAGMSADALYFQGWSWQPFADKGQIAALEDYIEKDQAQAFWPDVENYHNNTERDGHVYMTAADTGSIVMFYAKELFDKAAVPYPTDGWTYADFQNAVEKTTRKEGDVQYYGYAQAGGWNGSYDRSLPWMRMDGALEWDRVVEPTKSNWMDERIISALQYTVVDVTARGLCPSPAAIQGGGISISTGRVALCMEGPWTLDLMAGEHAEKEGGVPFEVVAPPKGATGKNETCAQVHGHCLAKGSKYPDATWRFMKFILGDLAQQRIAKANGRMCGTPEGIEKYWVPFAQEAYGITNAKVFADSMRTGGNPIFAGAGANFDAVAGPSTPLAVAWDAMLNGTSAQEAVSAAHPLLQKILDDYWAKKQG